jgi:hypothetical protein
MPFLLEVSFRRTSLLPSPELQHLSESQLQEVNNWRSTLPGLFLYRNNCGALQGKSHLGHIQGGSDISGTLSKLHRRIKKSTFLLIILC